MKPTKRAYRGCLLGLLIELFILVALIFIFVAAISLSYDGGCWAWNPDKASCSFWEYMKQSSSYHFSKHFLVHVIVLVLYFWWLVLPLALAFPLVGFLVGLISAKGNRNQVSNHER
jgi:hypothetical protein